MNSCQGSVKLQASFNTYAFDIQHGQHVDTASPVPLLCTLYGGQREACHTLLSPSKLERMILGRRVFIIRVQSHVCICFPSLPKCNIAALCDLVVEQVNDHSSLSNADRQVDKTFAPKLLSARAHMVSFCASNRSLGIMFAPALEPRTTQTVQAVSMGG